MTSSPVFWTVPSEMTLYFDSSKRSEYSSKPWARPQRDSSTQAPMKAPVAYPAALSRSASVVRASSRKKPPLSRAPWCGGMRPVKIDECDGKVRGAVAVAFSKTTPCRASASRCGVSIREKP